jgi:hypothetical protein
MIVSGGGNCGSDLHARQARGQTFYKKADTNEGCAGTTLELLLSLYSKSLLLGSTRNFLEGKARDKKWSANSAASPTAECPLGDLRGNSTTPNFEHV